VNAGLVSQHLFLIICRTFKSPHTVHKKSRWRSSRCGGLPLGAFYSNKNFEISGSKLNGTGKVLGKVSKFRNTFYVHPLIAFPELSKHSRKMSVLVSLPSVRSRGQAKKTITGEEASPADQCTWPRILWGGRTRSVPPAKISKICNGDFCWMESALYLSLMVWLVNARRY